RVTYCPSGAFWLITPSRSRKAALFMKNCMLGEFGNDVTNQDVAFLNARSFVRWGTETVVGCAFHFPARASGKSYGVDSHLLRSLETAQNIRRIAARGNTDGHITGTAQRLKLPREQQIEAVVIPDRRDAGSIYRKSQRWQCRTIKSKAANELG